MPLSMLVNLVLGAMTMGQHDHGAKRAAGHNIARGEQQLVDASVVGKSSVSTLMPQTFLLPILLPATAR